MSLRALFPGLLATLVLFGAGSISAQPTTDIRFTVIGSDGKPALNATVCIMRSGNLDLDHKDGPLTIQRLKTDDRGEALARIPFGVCMWCCLAFNETEAALICREGPENPPTKPHEVLRLGKARRLRARLVDPEGKPVANAKVRAIGNGERQMVGVDGTVGEDGSVRFPPLPPTFTTSRYGGLEVLAPGFVHETIPFKSVTSAPVAEIRLKRPRTVSGRIVGPDGSPVVRAKVFLIPEARFAEYPKYGEDEPRTDAEGRFRAEGLTPDALIVYAVPKRHAPWSTAVPAGHAAVDLGDIRLSRGLPIAGMIRESDRAPILDATVWLDDARGVPLRSAHADSTGRFLLKHLMPGITYRLRVCLSESKGIAGRRYLSLEVSPALKPLTVEFPRGLSISLVDEEGKPVDVARVDLRVEGPRRTALGRRIDGRRGKFHELRFTVRGPAAIKMTLEVRGYEEAVVEAKVDENGKGHAEAVLVAKPGEILEPPRPRVPPRPSFMRSKPKSPALKKIKLPPDPAPAQVRNYVHAILDATRGRRSWSSTDPEVEMLRAVGPEHVNILIGALPRYDGEGSRYVHWALPGLVEERHRDLIIGALADSHELIRIVVARRWVEAAKETLVSVLAQRPFYLPREWIEAVASFKDKSTYPDLRGYLIYRLNRRSTYRAVRDLPGFEIERVVRVMWAESERLPIGRLDAAVVAAECGIVEALGVLIHENASKQPGFMRPRDLGGIVARLSGQALSPDELVAWYEKSRERLVFDRDTKSYRVK